MLTFLHSFPPAWLMIIGGLCVPLLRGTTQRFFALALPVITLWSIWHIQPSAHPSVHLAGFTLDMMHLHPYTHIFATAFCIAAFGGLLFGLFQARTLEFSSALIYAGSAIGITFSGDLISLFFYWEIMALSSTLVIFASDRPKAKSAGLRYIGMHLFGGVVLMTGIALHVLQTKSIAITPLDTSMLLQLQQLDMHGIAMWFMLVGILVNAAALPLSAWLPDAYPEASPSGSVFLSAFTTKTAVFVLLTLFAGTEVLIYVGLAMACYGILYALLENDIRRILSYGIINQVGFMVVGIGIGTPLALKGVALHAFCHIIYKALLFMSAGSVLYQTGKSQCTQLHGLGRSMIATSVCGGIGLATMAAFPFTSGFISKSLILSAVAESNLTFVWLLLLAASAGVLLMVGLIATPWFRPLPKDHAPRPNDPPWNMRVAMGIFAVFCLVPAIPGMAHASLFWMLPEPLSYHAYTGEHIVRQLQLLFFAGLAFAGLLPLLKRSETISLDFDWLYRHLGRQLCHYAAQAICAFRKHVAAITMWTIEKVSNSLHFLYDSEGVLSRSWPLGTTATWAAASLALYMALYYFL
jgi:multicomponent Na+:H+ antiporter subunit D